MNFRNVAFGFLLLFALFPADSFAGAIVRQGDTWRYFKGTSTPPVQGTNTWAQPAFNDASWLGPSASGFGYGDNDDATALGDMLNSYVTVFTRKSYVIADTNSVTHLALAADYDDGFVAYINGTEVARRNMPAGSIVTHTNTAAGNHEASRPDDPGSLDANDKEFITLNKGVLVNGTNLLAVSGHNISVGSSDFSLAVELYTNVTLVRGPFIQMPDTNGLLVVWRTDAETDSVVDYGLDPGYSGGTVSNGTLTRFHEVALTNLLSGTSYFYRVRSGGVTLSEGNTLRTRAAYSQPYRVTVIGDFGNGSLAMSNVAARVNATNADILVTVGDNIYSHGQPGDYDGRWFSLYQSTMRRAATFPALGNHDTEFGNDRWMATNFFLPANGPVTMLPETVYSFDYGNAHFSVIHSDPIHNNDAAVISATRAWLTNDLATTVQPWKFVMYHHPPYTSEGNHPDDVSMQANIAPIFSQYGVQLVLQGHNHFYERINAIDGVYYMTVGGGGQSLYPIVNQKTYSAARNDTLHSFAQFDIDGTRLIWRAIDENGSLIDSFDLDIGHPFRIDGLLDDWTWMRAEHGLRLFAAIKGNYLYVATQDAGENSDHFIYLNNQISTNRPTNWDKQGQVMQWSAFLADEDDNAYQAWYDATGAVELNNVNVYRSMTSGLNNNYPSTNGVLEGTVQLVSHFGSFPTQVCLAAGPWATTNNGPLFTVAQVPAPVIDNQIIESNEFLCLNTRSIALDLPVAVARSNQTAEAGMTVQLDGASSTAPSGLPLSYAWQQLSGPSGLFSAPTGVGTSFRLTNNVPASTNVPVQLTVNDTRFDSNAVVTLTFFPLQDADGDGLSDQEELTGFDNSLTFPNPAGYITPTGNPDGDGDGQGDGAEAIAGTVPTNAQSRFEIAGLGDSIQGVVIQWTSASNRFYSVYRTTNLTEFFSMLATNLPATIPINAYTDSVSALGQSFYLIDAHP